MNLKFKFNSDGLVPAIVQQTGTGQVLMLAYMNELAIKKTLETGLMHYWSRSRKQLWLKGETSGHTQRVVRSFVDCDADTLLFEVEQQGAACHTGYATCFFQPLNADGTRGDIDLKKVFDPEEVYHKK
jgi:phosphoribosyl-AMP cyclohydrolase